MNKMLLIIVLMLSVTFVSVVNTAPRMNQPASRTTITIPSVNPFWDGIIGWAAGKVLDWLSSAPCSTLHMCGGGPANGVGGGGGDAFGPGASTGGSW